MATCKLCDYTGRWSWTKEHNHAEFYRQGKAPDFLGPVITGTDQHSFTKSRDERDKRRMRGWNNSPRKRRITK